MCRDTLTRDKRGYHEYMTPKVGRRISPEHEQTGTTVEIAKLVLEYLKILV